MNTQSTKIKDKFTGHSNIEGIKHNLEGRTKSFKYFAISEDKIFLRRFKLKFRDGRRVSIPYAFLPIIELENNKHLSITSGDIVIRILGRGLGELEEWLTTESVIWIKESESGHDDGNVQVFISTIEIEGL